MANMHLKIYNYSESDIQVKRKKQFKNEFLTYFKAKVADEELDKKRQGYKTKVTGDDMSKNGANDDDESEKLLRSIPEEEKTLIHNFLRNFVLDADSGNNVD